MIHAHIYIDMQEAEYRAGEFIKKYFYKIRRVMKNPIQVRMNNWDIHCFMSSDRYKQWCRGKTYMIDGTLYCNGFIVERSNDDEIN